VSNALDARPGTAEPLHYDAHARVTVGDGCGYQGDGACYEYCRLNQLDRAVDGEANLSADDRDCVHSRCREQSSATRPHHETVKSVHCAFLTHPSSSMAIGGIPPAIVMCSMYRKISSRRLPVASTGRPGGSTSTGTMPVRASSPFQSIRPMKALIASGWTGARWYAGSASKPNTRLRLSANSTRPG